MGKAKYRTLYRRIGQGIVDGDEVTFECECHAFEGWDGRRVGVIRWLVRARRHEREIDSGEYAMIERSMGYFADTVERAVSMFRELNETYNRCAEVVEVLHG